MSRRGTSDPKLIKSQLERLPLITETERQDRLVQSYNQDHLELRKQNSNQKRPVVVIKPLEQSKPYCGSLYNMFSSELFSLPMLMQYYFKKFNQHGVHTFLTNKLFEVPNEFFEFYVPQLCFLMIKQQQTQYLEKLLQDKCALNMHMFFLINWCFQAFADADKKDKKKHPKIQRVEELLEQAMINGKIDSSSTDGLKQKTYKLNYEQSVNSFISNLIELSLILKTHKPEDRKKMLKDYIVKANKALHRYKERNSEITLCSGIVFPFASERSSLVDFETIYTDSEEKQFSHSNLIVRIVEDECTCFNTKKRVPYRIVVETIDVQELELRKSELTQCKNLKNYFSKTRSELDLDADGTIIDDFLFGNNKHEKEYLEKMMKEIVNSKRNRNFGDLQKLQQDIEIQSQTIKGKGTFLENMLNDIKGRDLGPSEEQQIARVIETKMQISEIMQQRKKFATEQESRNFDVLMKRFEIMFPTRHNDETSSCINFTGGRAKKKKLVFDYNRYNNYRLRHFRDKDLTIFKRIKFFKSLFQQYPQKNAKLKDMFTKLQYDIMDLKYQKKMNQQNHENELNCEEDINFPRKFGPWETLWEDKAILLKRQSPFQSFKSYRLRPIIVKGGDDLRQELMAMQIITLLKETFQTDVKTKELWIKNYEITVVSASSGILEFCTDTLSIDGLKKKMATFKNLSEIYRSVFANNLREAQENFIHSLAAYSIICYILQIKDRHNGNILIDSSGHIIHIDFGFMLCTSPGGINFESAPFKLTQEYVEIMDGKNSDKFKYFKSLIVEGFQAMKKVVDDIVTIVQIMMEDSDLPCFEKFDLKVFRDRFHENLTQKELQGFVNEIVEHSYDNWRTIQYDNFQRMTNGIMP